MDQLLAQIDRARLAEVVARAMGRDAVAIATAAIAPLGYENISPDSRGLYRLAGTARADGQIVGWSLVLKLFAPPTDPRDDDPAHPFFWRREALAYQSGLLADLPGDLAAPRCYAVTTGDDRRLWLWLEDLGAAEAAPWPLERYGLAARQLGQLGGAYLAARPLPDAPWLSRARIRAAVEEAAGQIPLLSRADLREHPLLRERYPAALLAEVRQLWDDRAALLDPLARLPRTLCHNDLWRNNLFGRQTPAGRHQTVAIDWELIGLGAAGEDLGNLLGVCLLNCDVPAAEAARLADLLLSSYLAGLREAGWSPERGPDPAAIRFACATAAALRCVFSTAGWPLAIVGDERGRLAAETEARWHRPLDAILEQWAAATRFLLDQAAEARRYGA